MVISSVLVVAGLVLLTFGGDVLTTGAAGMAYRLGIRPVVVGLTVVAFGTSLPEGFVSIVASFSGSADIAIANVIGSNLFNIGVVMGVAALIRPLKVEKGSIRREVPFLVGSALLLWLLAADGRLGRGDGAILTVLFVAFLWTCFRKAAAEDGAAEESSQAPPGSRRRNTLKIVLGLLLLAAGSKLLVSGAIDIARTLGVSELLIGITIVAAGTSLPELAASVMASLKGHDDIAVGNIVGSGIFNILFVLGCASLIHPLSVNALILSRDVWVMAGFSLAVVPIMRSGFVISRKEGALLFMCYLIYAGFLVKAG
ncbi:MAG: calcium/sodium antiporter [Candidatus Omnitrophica bacterium]|nr:calcium/sodium antiporter [Candidatus Omnitrophota bacterium]